jgi:hypothetical protein
MDGSSFAGAVFSSAWLYIYWILYGLTNCACAYFVYQDAIKQNSRALNIGPYWWGAFSLLGGVWTLLAYWLMQHSTLVKPRE